MNNGSNIKRTPVEKQKCHRAVQLSGSMAAERCTNLKEDTNALPSCFKGEKHPHMARVPQAGALPGLQVTRLRDFGASEAHVRCTAA